MKKITILLLLFFVYSLSLKADSNYKEGELILLLNKNVSQKTLENHFKNIWLKPKEVLVPDLNIWLYEYEPSRMSADRVLENVKKDPAVLIAQFNHYVTQRDIIPNDPSFTQQWSLNNTGQNGGTPDADIDAPEAWGLNTGGLTALGDTIIVAVVDCGFYLTHQDLNFWRNWREIPGNGIDDDSNGYVDDVNGWNAISNNGNITTCTHGSHVSGIAGAIGNNSNGIAGVNWNVQIMAVQGSSGTESVVIRAYGYVLKQRKLYRQTNGVKGAFVVSTNSSFGVDYGQPSQYPLWCAFYDSLGTEGILNACATANLNINVDVVGDIPTACPSPFMVSVTNTTNTDAKNSGAAYGLLTIDLGAPGTNIYSTLASPNSYGNLTGTSMATPHVAGGIAIMYSAGSPAFIQAYKLHPDSIALIVKDKLLQGTDPKPSLQGITVSGGRLNINNSMLLIAGITATGNLSGITPVNYNLYQNYPNPFNPSTVIRYDVPKAGFVSIKIYDETGREISSLVNKEQKPGEYEALWDAGKMSSGIYFYTLSAGDKILTKKMALVK